MKLTYVHKTALSWSPNLSVRDMAASLGSQPQSLSVLESETVFISTLSGDSQKIKWQCPVSFVTKPSVELSFQPMLKIAVMGVLQNPGSIEPSVPVEPLVCMLSIPSLPQLRPTPPLPSLSMQELLVKEDEEMPPPPPPSKALLQATLTKEA